MDLNNRLLGFQKAAEEDRNLQNNNIKLLLADMINQQMEVPQITIKDAEVLQIEDNHK